MLYRPILTRLLASEISGESNNSLQASFNRDGARACVNSAISLITLVRDTFSTDHTGAWWWNALCTCHVSLRCTLQALLAYVCLKMLAPPAWSSSLAVSARHYGLHQTRAISSHRGRNATSSSRVSHLLAPLFGNLSTSC